MTASPKLDAFLDTIPGRCPSCRWSVKEQGHAPTCEAKLAERRAVVDSVAHDWRSDPDWLRFVEACAATADADGVVRTGPVRRRLSNEHGLTIQPRRLSAFWSRAAARDGFLEFFRWETNDDHAGRNAGRPARVYRYRSP